MRRDRLAVGETTSQIFSAAESKTTQLKWDLAFLTAGEFVRTNGESQLAGISLCFAGSEPSSSVSRW